MAKFYTADWHIGHENILKLARRPFDDIAGMNQAILSNINRVVRKNDELYILGDLFLKISAGYALDFLNLMNGNKHLILGNHDTGKISSLPVWKSVSQIKVVKDGGLSVVLCHYPMASWEGMHRGAVHLHGHSHGTIPDIPGKRFDVGVDPRNFYPVELEELLAPVASIGRGPDL